MDELERLNKKYEDMSNGIFPFIGKSRVTVLKKGFYSKLKADYRGISMIYDKKKEKAKAILIGYYYVPNNYVIVPEGLTITEGKKNLIKDKLNDGYEVILKFPSLKPYEFDIDAEEYKVAKEINEQFKADRL